MDSILIKNTFETVNRAIKSVINTTPSSANIFLKNIYKMAALLLNKS
jgi:hypothetical protein